MTIIFRTDGLWGTGKGSRLTKEEVDGNFYSVDQRLTSIEDSPPEAVSIASIDVTSSMMTITMTDSSQFGPFVLPTATWRATGAWVASRNYAAFDIVTNAGSVYLVLLTHTADTTFDPNADQGSGFLYSLMLAKPSQPYDIFMSYNASIPVSGVLLAQAVSVLSFTIPGDFLLSKAFLRVAPSTSTIVLEVRKADQTLLVETVIGTITFDPSFDVTFDGGMFGVFAGIGSPTDDIAMAAGDRLNVYSTFLSPDDPDPVATGLSMTFACLTGGE